MDTITITYENRTVALAARDRFWLASHIEALADGDPTKRIVAFMALFARDILTGTLLGKRFGHRGPKLAGSQIPVRS